MPEASEWETEYLTWQHKMHSREKKELPEEFTTEKMVIEQEGSEGGVGRWQPAPRETEADIAMDTRSLRRKLDQRLFLLVKGKGKLPTPPRNQAEASLHMTVSCLCQDCTCSSSASRMMMKIV